MATDHRAAWANANIWQSPPWALALVVVCVGMMRGRAGRRTFWVAVAVAAAAVVGLAAKILPGVSQDNLAFILLFLPMWAGLAHGVRSITRDA